MSDVDPFTTTRPEALVVGHVPADRANRDHPPTPQPPAGDVEYWADVEAGQAVPTS